MIAIVAHRGASRAERENTLRAFRRAAELGADAVEFDVRRTADDALVIHHNPHFPDGRLVRATRFVDVPAEVPTLDEALDACDGMWVNIEIKNDETEDDFDPTDRVADAVIEALIERGEPHRWLTSSFRYETIERCRNVAPSIATAWLTVEVDGETAAKVAAGGHRAVHPWFGNTTAEFIADCHRLGVRVNVWTCDDPDWMRRLAAWQVDGICTNVPDLAREVLRD